MPIKHCYVCDTDFTIDEPENTKIYKISLKDHINSKFHQRKLKSGFTVDELSIIKTCLGQEYIRYGKLGPDYYLYLKIRQILGAFD